MSNEKHSGFHLPEGYFESFSERIEKRLKQEGQQARKEAAADRHTEALSPEPVKAGPGFRLPKGYFESFGERLRDRMEDPAPKVVRLDRSWMAWTAGVAAALILSLVLWPASESHPVDFGDLADAEIEYYLEIGYDESSAYEVAESLPVEHIDMADVMDTQTKEQQMLEFLDKNPEVLDELILDEDE